MSYYAHSLPETPPEEWQPLLDHLYEVARQAAAFANPFGGEEWAYLAGLWHDVGKGTLPWQAYLRRSNGIFDDFTTYYKGNVEHAVIGAQKLYESNTPAAMLLAYCLAGHHGGLPNWSGSAGAALSSRLSSKTESVQGVDLPPPAFPERPPFTSDSKRSGYQLQFYDRMLFSCLVDADYLDTEKALDATTTTLRGNSPSLSQLQARFEENFQKLREEADSTTVVNQQRETVLHNCLDKASHKPGLFSLTVPTGGGKTLATLAFALEHARQYGKERIIYVIPFTSIIEQNAAVFRDMLGPDAVIEHHSNFIPEETDWQTRLASENWDASVIVTTNVQFFDSFYANQPSKCRKLHNVANSVIIFDEVQAIPVEKVKPCLEVIRELTGNYEVSSVLCTATQPAFNKDQFDAGLNNVREIIDDVPSLFSTLKRTKETYIGEIQVEDLVGDLCKYHQVLCIVNTRRQAFDIFEAMPDSQETFHLSASMYPLHRSRKLYEIRQRLEKGLPCRVISTQLVEAGVDIDFPVVYRAVAGVDSIAQAAGRCNRNGEYPTPCEVFIFHLPEEYRCSVFRKAAQSSEKLFKRFEGQLTAPECVQEYFLDYFWKNEHKMDDQDILRLCSCAARGEIQFADIANFQMINSPVMPIIVAVEEDAVELVQSLEHATHKGGILRKLQQYTVQVYPYQFDELRGWCEQVQEGIWVLRSEKIYTDNIGLAKELPQGDAFFV